MKNIFYNNHLKNMKDSNILLPYSNMLACFKHATTLKVRVGCDRIWIEKPDYSGTEDIIAFKYDKNLNHLCFEPNKYGFIYYGLHGDILHYIDEYDVKNWVGADKGKVYLVERKDIQTRYEYHDNGEIKSAWSFTFIGDMRSNIDYAEWDKHGRRIR